MKIRSNKIIRNKLLSLDIVKNKLYKVKEDYISIKHIESSLKKTIQIIYKFHIENKKIIFIGGPYNTKLMSLLKKTKHTNLPDNFWLNALVTNRASIFKSMAKERQKGTSKATNKYKLMYDLRSNYDLVVILGESRNREALKELMTQIKPMIILNVEGNNLRSLKERIVEGKFKFNENDIKKNIFIKLLIKVLKKANKFKKPFIAYKNNFKKFNKYLL